MLKFENGRLLVSNVEKEFKNVVEVETALAKYRILFTRHDFLANPEIVHGSDGVILELISELKSEEKVQETIRYMEKSKFSTYKSILNEAAQAGVPIYLPDLSKEVRLSSDFKKRNLKDGLSSTSEGALGLVLALAGIRLLSKEQMSRRDFLKGGALLAAGAFATFPQANVMANVLSSKEIDETTLTRKAEHAVESMTYYAHPELRSAVVDMRNDLIAQKSETIAQRIGLEKGSKPTLAIVIGGGHIGIERSFKKTEQQRLDYLKNELGNRFEGEGTIAEIKLPKKLGTNGDQPQISIFNDQNFK